MSVMPVASWGIANLCFFNFMNVFAILKTPVRSVSYFGGNFYLFMIVLPPTCYQIFVANSIFSVNGKSPRGEC